MRKKIIWVVWVDSFATGGWRSIEYLDKPSKRQSTVESVGYLIHECRDFITISTSISHTNNTIDPITIPKVAIVKRKTIPV